MQLNLLSASIKIYNINFKKLIFMKKIKISLVLCLITFATVCTAQIKVDDQGRVIFGKQPYSTAISIVDESTTSGWNPFRITYKSNQMVTLSRNTSGSAYGMMFTPTGSILIGNSLPASSSTYIPLEVYGCDFAGGIKVTQPGSSAVSGISVNISTSASNNAYPYEALKGSNRIFYVNSNGVVYCNGATQSTSDVSLKKNIETILNPLEKVLQLRGVTFQMNFPKTGGEEKELSDEEAYQSMKNRTPEMTPEIFKQIQEEKSRNEMGVIAQEVEKVIPEVVRTREDGLKSVAYSEMVGLLIEAIKELKSEMDELKGNSSFLRSATNETETTGIADPVISQCKLYQNAPNPFTHSTEIKYYLSDDVSTAFLCIYNLQGRELKQMNLREHGAGSQMIHGHELPAGMYLYALIVDGKEVDTKRMILTK